MGRRRKRDQGNVHGVLCVDKPSGSSSAWLARRVGRGLGTGRAGHAGTLDPFATGVLVVLLGEATKLSRWLTAHDKEYLATLQFGVETDTLDREGEVVRTTEVPGHLLTSERLQQEFEGFLGKREQVVPVYSAVRVDGKRLMKEARAGRHVTPPSRCVECYSLEIIDINSALAQATIRMHCSKGYYVRSFARDLGRCLGVGAHLRELRRTRSGPFSVHMAVGPDDVTIEDSVALSQALGDMPVVRLNDSDSDHIRHGRRIRLSESSTNALVTDPQGTPIAVVVRTDDDQWRVERGLRWTHGAQDEELNAP